MYAIHNEGKSVVTERVFRRLKNKTYKCMVSIQGNMYTDKLGDLVKKDATIHIM